LLVPVTRSEARGPQIARTGTLAALGLTNAAKLP
jgi:hypothetical protein